jgi:SAM-dependent methyltransferase
MTTELKTSLTTSTWMRSNMKLSKETKDLIRKEYNEFKEAMYAGKSLKERQELDQFFTPPEISIRLIEELSDLSGNVLDPTCGSGNLLAAALIAGADSDKVFGNDYDAAMVVCCRDRLNKVCDQLGKAHIQDWQIHRGNALIPDCLTEFRPDYDETILVALLKKHWGLKGGWMDNPDKYSNEAQVELF